MCPLRVSVEVLLGISNLNNSQVDFLNLVAFVELVFEFLLETNWMFFLWKRLGDFKEFAGAIDAIKDKGVVVAVASPDDVDAANKERPNFFQVKKAL